MLAKKHKGAVYTPDGAAGSWFRYRFIHYRMNVLLQELRIILGADSRRLPRLLFALYWSRRNGTQLTKSDEHS